MSTNEQSFWPDAQPLMDEHEFASRVRSKYPEYQGMDDADLTRRVVGKYPEYRDKVQLSNPQTFDVGSGVSVVVKPPQGMKVEMSSTDPDSLWPIPRNIPSVESSTAQGLWGGQTEPMDERAFAGKIRAKYPGEYDALSDIDLSRRVLRKYPEYRPLVRLPDAALNPSVTSSVNEDVDYGTDEVGPVKDFKPVEYTPADTGDLSTLQRVAEGWRQMGGGTQLPRPTDPNLYAKPLTITMPDSGRKPSKQELTDAYFNALGPGASEVNRRYRNETGRDIETPDISDQYLEMGYDAANKVYNVRVAPTQAALHVLNAYGTGGMKAAQDVLTEMQRAGDEGAASQAKERDRARAIIRRLGFDPDQASTGNGPLIKGLARAGLNATQIVNNAAGLFRNPADSANDAEYINEAKASMPKEKTAAGRIVENVAEAGGTLPLYTAAGPYGAGLVGFTQNLDRGTEQAAKEGLKLSAAGGIAHGAGIAFENLSPIARQVAARHLAGMTNVGLDKLSGSDRNALGSYLSAFVLPVGAKGRVEETGPTFDYVHETLGGLKRSPDQAGLKDGYVRVFDTEGNEFVARKPNAEGEGGLRNTDGSKPSLRRGEKFLDVVNIPRATQTAFDMSAVGRQGLILSVLHPVKAAKNFGQSVKALFSEKEAGRIQNEIDSSPLAPIRKESGLYLSDYNYGGGLHLTRGEEGFQSSVAQSIPGVRASERAYTTFLNKMRTDVFDGYVNSHPAASPETLSGIASFINKATGRGDLGAWGEKHAQALSQAFYSPRYTLSRIQLPLEMFKGTSQSRTYAARNLVQFVGSGIAFMGLAKAAGLEVGTDPLSSSFGKIKIGNTQVDLWGGSAQLARYTAQLIAGQATTQEGATRPRPRLQTAINFLRTRAAPQISVPLDTALGSDAAGQPANLSNLPRRTFLPLAWRDVEDAIRDDLKQGGSGVKGAAVGSLSLLGVGANTITPKSQDERLNDYVERMKTEPDNQGLNDEQLRHNAKVNMEAHRLMQTVSDAGLTDEQREKLWHEINSRLMDARVRGADDRRALPSIQRVFNERLQGLDGYVQGRLAELKRAPRERITARLQNDRRAAEARGGTITRVSIPMSRARAEAQKEGVSLKEYLSIMNDNGVEVVDDK